jgi:[acyl-carrier-protein] S-malonyltransferase
MGKLAFLFPGQGSQYVGMGSDLHQDFAAFRDVMQVADGRLGFPLSRLCFDGPEDQLTLTANTQPAILAHSVGVWRIVADAGFRPDVVAGHSLGEYSALVAAGALSLSDAVYAVRRRGEMMQEAVPVGEGTMAAILGLEMEEVAGICRRAADGEVVELANLNCPGQIVIAGHVGAVNRALELARERGAKRAIQLQVSAPFHSSLMAPARDGMRDVLDKIGFNDLDFPLINNADVSLVTNAVAAREGLIKQIVSPVRWEESIRKMLEMGVDIFVELGPGKVLCGLVKRIDRGVNCLNAEDRESLTAMSSELKSLY